MPEFAKKLAQLQADLNTQGDRVVQQLYKAVEACFGSDNEIAESVLSGEAFIDQVDVEIERACIDLLRLGSTEEKGIRSVLTVVKVNNELERIADCGKHTGAFEP